MTIIDNKKETIIAIKEKSNKPYSAYEQTLSTVSLISFIGLENEKEGKVEDNSSIIEEDNVLSRREKATVLTKREKEETFSSSLKKDIGHI